MMTYSGRNTLKIFLRDISNWYVYDYVCFICNSLLEVHGNIRNQFKVLRRTDKRNKDEGIDNIMGKYCALVKVIPQQAEVAQGVPGFLDVRHYKGGRSSALRTGRLYPRRNPRYSFSEAESTPGHMVPSVATEKFPSDTTGNLSRDRPTNSAVQVSK